MSVNGQLCWRPLLVLYSSYRESLTLARKWNEFTKLIVKTWKCMQGIICHIYSTNANSFSIFMDMNCTVINMVKRTEFKTNNLTFISFSLLCIVKIPLNLPQPGIIKAENGQVCPSITICWATYGKICPSTTLCGAKWDQQLAKYVPAQPDVGQRRPNLCPHNSYMQLVHVAGGQTRPQNALCPDIRCCCQINIPHTQSVIFSPPFFFSTWVILF